MPVALSVAGSDSGGGAGIQADLRAFRFFGVFGTTAITAVTAQNPGGVSGVHPVPPTLVQAQIRAVLNAFAVGACKTGMLFSAAIIREVSAVLKAASVPVVVDPVMVATSGARLLEQDAIATLGEELLPLAAVLTPNLPETAILLGWEPDSEAATVAAARELAERVPGLVLVKGGHAAGARAVDVLSDGDRVWRLSTPEVDAKSAHGTGCSLSAAIAACLARGHAPLDAVVRGKAFVYGSLAAARQVGVGTWAMESPDALDLAAVDVREIPRR
jgi:hydroxymethylpyrimidine/phosphomethylpyrimidine kinase